MNRGFTLIELLIVISILGILTTFTIASYRTFDSSQKFNNARNDLINTLQVARSRASSQYAPAQYCDQTEPRITDYRVLFSGQTMTVQVNCKLPGAPLGTLPRVVDVSSSTFPGSVTVSSPPLPFTVTFNIQGPTTFSGGIPSPATITITDGSQEKKIVITSNGRIDAL